jgi:hypothetical protein
MAAVLPAAADLEVSATFAARPLPITGAAIPGTASVSLRTPPWRSVDDDARANSVSGTLPRVEATASRLGHNGVEMSRG